MLQDMVKKMSFSLLLLAAGCACNAQDTIVLSLKQAVQWGMDSSKTLKISAARLDLAEAKYNQAVDATIPSVKFSAGYTRLSNVDEPGFLFPGSSQPVKLFPVYVNNYSSSLSVSETIFSGFRLKYAKESQQLLRDAAKFENDNQRTETAFTIVSAYFNLYKLQASEQVLEENLKQVNERLRETELARQNGLATKNDILRWQLQVSGIELARIDLRNNIAVANYNLGLMLGLAEGTIILPDSAETANVPALKPVSEYLATALENRSDLAATLLQERASKNAMQVARNSYLPRIQVNGEFLDARPNARYIPPVDEFHATWAAGISLNWDLVGLYSNRHGVDEAGSYLRQSEAKSGLVRDQVKSEINQNFLLCRQALQKADVMLKTVEQSAENYRLTDARYRNNLVVLSDLLDANTQLLNAQINYSFAQADIQIAYYRLLKSTGTSGN
jgi:outer membrane protein TolC